MLQLTATKPQLNVVFDQVGTPTYARDLAEAIISIINNVAEFCIQNDLPPSAGIYHFSNEGVCSWYDFAKTIAEYARHTDCDIQPCHSDEFPSKVNRPAYSVLDKTKIKERFGLKVPYWTDSLRKCIDNLQKMK
jgi:dTDP-4-dehydrorhamnose reductase